MTNDELALLSITQRDHRVTAESRVPFTGAQLHLPSILRVIDSGVRFDLLDRK